MGAESAQITDFAPVLTPAQTPRANINSMHTSLFGTKLSMGSK